MNDDFSQPIPQGGDGAKDSENCRIAAIANKLEGLCAVYEAQPRDGRQHVNRFWIPRNVLVDSEGDIFVVDAEIKELIS